VSTGTVNPAAALMALRDQGADMKMLLTAINRTYAVVKYGGEIVVASIIGNKIEFMKTDEFHKMFANLVVHKSVEDGDKGASESRTIQVSKRWFNWGDRRQFLGRGVVFEPGGRLEIPGDTLNLWRGYGVEPKRGEWPLLKKHILEVVCSGNQDHFDYLMKWMAHSVQHLDEPAGVAVALLGAQGAGKGIVARTFGKFFGKHFAHISHGDQLTGRFNASLGTACTVFLDEALWAGDKKGEGVLKALITEPSFQLEAKFRDPIMVENRLRIIVASNSGWAVPAGIGDRRWFVLNVADTYAGTGHRNYWTTLYNEIESGGAAAMLHDLLATDLKGFDVRAIPHTAAKAQQQALSLHGTMSWLYQVLQEGAIGGHKWDAAGLTVDKALAYGCYEFFSRERHEWHADIKDMWSKNIHVALGPNVEDTRPTIGKERVRSFKFAPLSDCRRQFATHIDAPYLDWEQEENEPQCASEYEPEYEPDYEPEDEVEYEPDYEDELEYEPEDEPKAA
jgi:Family of unknown function (DUF5906)